MINGKIAYSWICMTRICHAKGDCQSHVNLNDEKVEAVVWDFLKAELMDFADPKKDTRDERIQHFKQKLKEAQSQIPLYEEEIKKADLIVFSSGSLLTSILPNIVVPEIQEAIKKAKGKKMYISNMLTQPGETDNFNVSDHIKVLERYLGEGTINAVIANSEEIPMKESLFAKSEGKDIVLIDKEELALMNIKVISEKLFKVEDGYIRHNSLKTAFLIFSYLMEEN
jgi:uncharacterized cofD-like protein